MGLFCIVSVAGALMRELICIVLDVQVSLEFSLEVSCGGQSLKLPKQILFLKEQPHIFFFKFYFSFKLYIIVLVLPNIKMNLPQVYMCSPS